MLTTLTQAPEHDFGLIDYEPALLCWLHAGCNTGTTVRICYVSTVTAHQMMMIIASTTFESRRMSCRPDLAHQRHVHARREHVIYGLPGNGPEPLCHAVVDLFCGGVGTTFQPFENSATGGGHPQPAMAQLIDSGGTL